MNFLSEDIQKSILELQLKKSQLLEEMKEIDLQIKFLKEQQLSS